MHPLTLPTLEAATTWIMLSKIRFWGTNANEEKYTFAAGGKKRAAKKALRKDPAESLPNPQEGDSFEA
jgi:hypothetical protein